jgi:hypothetical protein
MIFIDYKLLLLSHVTIIEDLGILYARRNRALTYLMDVEKQNSDVRLLDLIVQYPVLVEPYSRSPLAMAI